MRSPTWAATGRCQRAYLPCMAKACPARWAGLYPIPSEDDLPLYGRSVRDGPEFSKENSMRTAADRIRHAISFEITGILLATPLGAFVFQLHTGDSAVIVIGSATVAMGWNYVFNLVFDHAMQRLMGTTLKPAPLRVLHAVL